MRKRPVVRYHGGKHMLAPWIISHFPAHRVYVEPFGGGASVLLQKPRVYAEVYNDLDGEIVNLFRVLQDENKAARLIHLLKVTPFARAEFNLAYQPCENNIERARRTCIKSHMGFGSAAITGGTPTGRQNHPTTGFRSCSNRSGTTPAHDWANYPNTLWMHVDRLRGVVLEDRDALACMKQHDGPETLHYVDPPYVHSTRGQKQWRTPCSYKHEMTDEQHAELLAGLKSLAGMVVLSGYQNDLYDGMLHGWSKVTRDAHADGTRDRVECLWLNLACRLTSLDFG